ncbi:cdc42 effector protein 5 [Onychostoma macrolepis]|nr:cdc42 effector protein 5 [Onychostoma macrolepis]
MPLHKSSSRTPRLDPTMISAPLGDFRHTMHIGRGGDAFGDTSFLSSHGPSSPNPTSVQQPDMEATVETTDNKMNHNNEIEYAEDSGPNELRHSDSVSSFDLDLDLGPSILGDVLGVMDGLMMGSHKDNEDVFSSSRSTRDVMMSPRNAAHELSERMRMESMTKEVSHRDEQLNEVNGVKSKGLRPKVRFSDKRDEIIGRQEVIEGLDVEVEEEMGLRPNKVMQEISGRTAYDKDPRQAEVVNRREDNSPSLSSSVSSEYEGVSPLDRRREDQHLSETDSEEEGANGQQGYTFEDEFDDEIGL